jgi:hypothetical protein
LVVENHDEWLFWKRSAALCELAMLAVFPIDQVQILQFLQIGDIDFGIGWRNAHQVTPAILFEWQVVNYMYSIVRVHINEEAGRLG